MNSEAVDLLMIVVMVVVFSLQEIQARGALDTICLGAAVAVGKQVLTVQFAPKLPRKRLSIAELHATDSGLANVGNHAMGWMVVATDEIKITTLPGRTGVTQNPCITTIVKSTAPTIAVIVVDSSMTLKFRQRVLNGCWLATRHGKQFTHFAWNSK